MDLGRVDIADRTIGEEYEPMTEPREINFEINGLDDTSK
jgi:hypothetical protein